MIKTLLSMQLLMMHMDGFWLYEEKKKLIEKWKQRWLNFLLILEGRNKGVKKIGLHHTPYATSPEFLKTSMGIVFYSLYQATVTM